MFNHVLRVPLLTSVAEVHGLWQSAGNAPHQRQTHSISQGMHPPHKCLLQLNADFPKNIYQAYISL